MSTIRIFSKKAFAFGPGADRFGNIEQFVTVPRAIQDMPEMYQTDKTFIAAVAAGDVQIMSTAAAVAVKVKEVEFTESDKKDPSVENQINEFYEELKGKSKDETKALAEKYGADYVESDKLSLNKKRVFEAFKLSLEK